MAAIKTKITKDSVAEYIANIEDPQKQKDSKALLKLFKEVTGEKPRVWSNNVVGFGTFHYKSERSAQQGEWFLTGFSARKGNITVYIMSGFKDHAPLLKKLGKHKTGGGCLYINKLEDVDQSLLKDLIRKGYDATKKRYAKAG